MYHGRNRLLICLMDRHRKASSVGKLPQRSLLLMAVECGWRNHFVWLSDLADELEVITSNTEQEEIQRCHTSSVSALLTKKEPTAPRRKYQFIFL